jgi:flavin reductase (DIM6/NTAB) family NADH-FMN oxidoreductase RutF
MAPKRDLESTNLENTRAGPQDQALSRKADIMPSEKVRIPHVDISATPRTTLSLAGGAIGDALDFAHFADTMASHAATVCIATSAWGDERHGRTVTAVTSLSAEPPSLLVSITRGSQLADMVLKSGGFSLNLLAHGQQELGDIFAGKRVVPDRFAIGEWGSWTSGQPKLAGAATVIDCRVAGIVELDTHTLFVGVLVGAETSDRKPLLWYRRGYRELSD